MKEYYRCFPEGEQQRVIYGSFSWQWKVCRRWLVCLLLTSLWRNKMTFWWYSLGHLLLDTTLHYWSMLAFISRYSPWSHTGRSLERGRGVLRCFSFGLMHSCITSEPAQLVEQLIGCNERLFRVNQCCNTEEEKDTQVGILHTGKRAHWTHSELD